MSASDWKTSLGFTARLTSIQSLTSAYQRASSSAAFAEAQSQARKLETEAYDRAASKEEYDQLCQDAVDAADAAESPASRNQTTDPLHDQVPEDVWARGVEIGPFRSCLPHFDGIHSSIFKSRREDGTLIAVKVTVPHLLVAPHDAKREIQLLREAASPHVMPLLETLKLDGGRLVLLFPFVRHDFEPLLRRDMVTASQTRSILRDMFRALAHVHEMGIIHRDIKPSNILLDSLDGPAYLADFGIAWKEGSEGSEPAHQKITDVGTTCYRPPEILFGYKEYGVALDLWAAGCLVAEAVAVGHRQLFDSGPVGSDLSLIQSIFTTLGTPDENSWPETKKLPDWEKVQFYKYPAKAWEDILRGASSKGRDLVSQLVRYESGQRISAVEALGHPYFSTS